MRWGWGWGCSRSPNAFYSPDQDNYNELFGALDNAFLVAYAIGMFIRYRGCAHVPHLSPRSPFGTTAQFPMLSPQWHFRGAAAVAVLPVSGHGAEWDLHSTLWLWLLLEHPRPVVLHCCAGVA